MSHGFIRHYDSMEFLPQGSGDFLFCIKYHSRYSNTFPAYIDCCVLIPVHSISARTLINAITQLQILFYVSTAETVNRLFIARIGVFVTCVFPIQQFFALASASHGNFSTLLRHIQTLSLPKISSGKCSSRTGCFLLS